MTIPTDDPIVVAPMPTPFTADDNVDFSAIEGNVQRWLKTPLSGFVLNSENGEEAFLSEAERLEIVRTVQRARAGEKFIVGGVDNPSVSETLRLADALVDAGAEMIRVRIPRLTENVRGYFEQVIPRCPAPVVVIHQMAPGRFLQHATSLGAPAELIGQFMSMDNAFGYITSDNLRFEARVRKFVPPQKRFWAPNGSLLLAEASVGANGACLMFGNVLPQACLDILRLAAEGDLRQAQAIQTSILEADFQILSRGAAGIKAALNLLGFRTGAPRSPSPPCDAEAVAEIRQALKQAGLVC